MQENQFPLREEMELPLVSLIVRTKDRPTLLQEASMRALTRYPNND